MQELCVFFFKILHFLRFWHKKCPKRGAIFNFLTKIATTRLPLSSSESKDFGILHRANAP